MDEKLFAHINNDAFLIGSHGLQGERFINTIDYLNKYITELKIQDPEILRLKDACNGLIEIERQLSNMMLFNASHNLSTLSIEIANKIKDLKNEDYLLVPGGWVASNGGHAIIYQFYKDKDGNILFQINNSGSGVQFHEKSSSTSHELYNSVLTYKIPACSATNVAILSDILTKLLTLQIPILHRKAKITADVLYQEIIPLFSHLDAEIVDDAPSTKHHRYTKGAMSGICAQNSLHQMLKARFSNLDNYRRFIYGLKMKSIQDYHKFLVNEHKIQDIKYLSQLEKAIKHNLRILNCRSIIDSKDYLFSEEKRKQDLEELKQYLAMINHAKRNAHKNKTTAANHYTTDAVYKYHIQEVPPVPIQQLSSKNTHEITALIDFQGGEFLLQELTTLIDKCNSLARVNDHALLEQLDNFIQKLPLPNAFIAPLMPFYASINNEDTALEFYQKLYTIQQLYFGAHARLLSEQYRTPNAYLAKLTFLTITSHINYNYGQDDRFSRNFSRNQVYDLLANVFHNSKNTPYLANQHPILDQRLQHIRNIIAECRGTNYYPALLYYKEILNENPVLRTKLEELYNIKYQYQSIIHKTNELHQKIREEKAQALYYFLTHRNDPNFDTILFAPFIKKFNIQCELERNLDFGIDGYTQDISCNFSFDLSYFYEPKRLQCNGPYSRILWSMSVARWLSATKFAVQDNICQQVFAKSLEYEKRRDNEIQLRSLYSPNNKRPITKQDLIEREFYHLRCDARTQIDLTLDYFERNPHHLNNKDYATYLEANIFQPGLLLKKFETPNNTIFLDRFEGFILNGLKYFATTHGISQQSIFLLKLKYLVLQYAFHIDVKQYRDKLNAYYEDLNVLLSSTQDKFLKSSLHKLRLLALVDLLQNTTPTSKQIIDLIFSNIYSNTVENLAENFDIDTKFKIEQKKHLLKNIIAKNKDLFSQENLTQLLPELNIRPISKLAEESKVRGDLTSRTAVYTSVHEDSSTTKAKQFASSVEFEERSITANTQELTIDPEQGMVFNNQGLALVSLPLHIINNKLYKKLGLKNTFAFTDKDKKNFYINEADFSACFIYDNGNYIVYKQFQDTKNEKQYFQLIPQTNLHTKEYCYRDRFPHGLAPNDFSAILKERDKFFWQHVAGKELLVTDITNKPCLVATSQNLNTWSFATPDKELTLINNNAWHNETIYNFENRKFISIYHDTKNNKYLIKLDRYALPPLLLDPAHNTLTIKLHNVEWVLDDRAALTQDVPALIFRSTKNAEKTICILPIQQFRSTNTRRDDNEYYALKLDTEGKIAEESMKTPLQQEFLWQHTNTQKHYVLKIKDGNVLVTNAAEALYLCYIYLGSHQPEKAWAILEYCHTNLGDLEGNFTELQYIYWICNKLPQILENDAEDAILEPAPYVAIKLKALALLTCYNEQYQSIKTPDPLPADNVNNRYLNLENAKVKQFQDSICDILAQKYEKYQAMQESQLVDFQLSHAERKTLLNYQHDNQITKLLELTDEKPKTVGSMGYDWAVINMSALKQELSILDTKAALSPYEIARRNKLIKTIRKHEDVYMHSSALKAKAIDLEIPFLCMDNINRLDSSTRRAIRDENFYSPHILPSSYSRHEAMEVLRPNITEDKFFENLHIYIAIAKEETHFVRAEKDNLLHFCRATIIQTSFQDLTKIESNIPILCRMLYKICHLRQDQISRKSSSLYDFFDSVKQVDFSAPPIMVHELAAESTQILQTANDIYKTLPTPAITKPITILEKEIENPSAIPTLFAAADDLKYIEAKENWHVILQSSAETQKPPTCDFLTAAEYQLGASQYSNIEKLKVFANEQFSDAKLLDLQSILTARLDVFNTLESKLNEELLSLANDETDDESLKLHWQIESFAAQRNKLTINNLLALFFKNDLTLYQEKTGLNASKIQDLHIKLLKYVQIATKLKHLQRAHKEAKAVFDASPTDKQSLRLKLGQILYAENVISPFADPSLAVYQLQADILIRPQQKDVLKRLININANSGYDERIERLIMGGGKTKVLLPSLAYKKATGENLVIVEVPAALLRTNYVDLKNTSLNLFGQDVHIFDFNRQSPCSPDDLAKLHKKLIDVMINKQYIITTKDALNSLELKYLELLSSGPTKDSRLGLGPTNITDQAQRKWRKQITGVEKLLLLLREKGDLVIDEVHQGLSFKHKLNYTINEPEKVDTSIIKNTILLFKFIATIRVNVEYGRLGLGPTNAIEILKHNASLSDNAYKTKVFAIIGDNLVDNASSPLANIVCNFTHAEKLQLKQYLLGQGDILPDVLIKLMPDEKEILALYKGQLTNLLPHTLLRNYKEHYGPSDIITDVCQKALAIPYVANNKPSERSRFGNYLETLNFTIQSLLIGGISLELLKSYIKYLQLQARYEAQDGLINIQDSPSAKLFKHLFKVDDIFLENLNLDDDTELVESLHRASKYNNALIYEILEHYVLPNLQKDSKILRSDAFNHVDMVRSCQGLSGTPWNHLTYHQRLKYDGSMTAGQDGLVYQAFLKKTENIFGFEFTNTKDAITTLFNSRLGLGPTKDSRLGLGPTKDSRLGLGPTKDSRLGLGPTNATVNINAIIDINATFKGAPNFEVACEIAGYLKKNLSNMKYVLYFNEHSEITALTIDDYPDFNPIVIGNSDVNVINERLDCMPHERFTFYDQEHTTGIDIAQAEDAHALVMLDERTMLADSFQGIMRMRQLIEGEQKLSLVVPPNMADCNVEKLCSIMHAHTEIKLKEEHYRAYLSQLISIIRNQALKKILAVCGKNAALEKRKLFLMLENSFITNECDDLIKKYGSLDKAQKVSEILTSYAQSLLERYTKLLAQNNLCLVEGENEVIKCAMDAVILAAIKPGICHEEQKTNLLSLGEAVEIQNEVQVELEKQHENEEEFFDRIKSERNYMSWRRGEVKTFLLESMCCSHKRADVMPIFTYNIKVSSNFAYSYTTQSKSLDMYLKPVHALLFKFENNKLSCTILSQQDCEEIQETGFIDGGWITTTHNNVLSGVAPPNITKNIEYQKIMEQVKFFNGEFSSLLAQKTRFHWLTDNTAAKIDFFEEHLYKSRETLPAHLEAMKKRWGKTTKLYQFITTHFFTDKTQYYRNAALFSELDKQQKHEIDYLIDVCHKISSEWEDLDLTKKDIYQENKLSLPAIGYLQCALEEVRKFKDLTVDLCQNSTKQSIAVHLQKIPEMANCLAPNTSLNKIAHQLFSLIQRKGLGLSKHIMCFLAKDPELTEEQLNSIFILAKTNNIVRCRLLYNEKLTLEQREELHQIMLQDNNLTQDELEYLKNLAKNNKSVLTKLFNNKSAISNTVILPALLQYVLPDIPYAQILENAIKLECGQKTASILLKLGNCPDAFIAKLKDMQFELDDIVLYSNYFKNYDALVNKFIPPATAPLLQLYSRLGHGPTKVPRNELLQPEKIKASSLAALCALVKQYPCAEFQTLAITEYSPFDTKLLEAILENLADNNVLKNIVTFAKTNLDVLRQCLAYFDRKTNGVNIMDLRLFSARETHRACSDALEGLQWALIDDANITQEDVNYIKEKALVKKSPMALLRLLNNKSPIVDATVLAELLTYEQSDYTIRASMYHPAFHPRMYFQLIQNAIKLKCGKEIATEILDRGNCKDFIKLLDNEAIYKQLIDNKTIKDEHLVAIVQHSTNQEAFRTLLNRSQDDKLRKQIPEEKIASLLSNTKGNVKLHSKITCNSHYFFNNMSRDAKDSEINKKLRELNLDIASQDKAKVQKSFRDIAKLVCTRRNKFASFFLGKYKTDTQSAENLLTKFSTNQDLLNLLDIKNQHIISAPLQLKHKMAESFIDDNKPCCFFRMWV